MRSVIYLLLTSLFCFFISCQTSKKETGFKEVIHKGALKNFMIEGDISAKADLQDLSEIDHLYAIGALENLQGEVQIFNSEPTISSVENNQMNISDSYVNKASLLVYTTVEKWKSISIPAEVITYDQLEDYIKQTAYENEIDIEDPFPFLIKGIMGSLDWHVIKWREGDSIHTHKKHRTTGLYGTLKNKNIEVLGFYSKGHHAVFTHHTTNMHLHFKTLRNDIAGHVDGLTMGSNMILKLPEK